MAEHDLKCATDPFYAVYDGIKTHEFRKNDRNFKTGDTLLLRQWDNPHLGYTGRSIRVRVTHVSRGPDWGIPEGYCCMSIRRAALEKKP